MRTEIEVDDSILLTCFGLPSQGLILALLCSTNMSVVGILYSTGLYGHGETVTRTPTSFHSATTPELATGHNLKQWVFPMLDMSKSRFHHQI